ncbi:MAG: hypothetical protein A2X49_00115 [Lentisphaerae bacterium GWF2_52_8]|nr:MAG: hypothetical protein A2X49_00115 [Lentisphaerae bacterium GWF2_52_8]
MHTPSQETLSFERGAHWCAAFDSAAPSLFSLKFKKQVLAELAGVSLSSYDERSALPGKFRRHEQLRLGAASAESSCVIPFGAEPRISREVAFVENHATITTDIDTHGNFPGRSISVDKLSISIPKRVGVLPIPAPGESLAWTWHELSPKTNIRSERPFLSCLCEFEDSSIEISSGFDLWRWAIAPSLGAEACFSLSAKKGKLEISRKVCEWPEIENVSLPSRQWRFRWHLAWTDKDSENSATKLPKDAIILDLAEEEWPDTATASVSGKEPTGAPCWLSNPVGKRLKNFVRTASAGQHLVARISGPQLCENAAHLERPGKEVLLHWDFSSLLDFWNWANRQLDAKGSRFSFSLDPSHPCACLPSLKAISLV